MDPQVVSPGDGAIDEQILGLLQHHRRLTFLTLAESLPLYTWQALFAALNRLRGQCGPATAGRRLRSGLAAGERTPVPDVRRALKM
ncbi:MAG TPA: hypothetical protein PK614_05950 [Nitrospira sp.]|nr:hypothetical protein [Nitrospira sp.]